MSRSAKRAEPANDAGSAAEPTLFPVPVASDPQTAEGQPIKKRARSRAARPLTKSETHTLSVSVDKVDIHPLNVRGREPFDENHVRALHSSIAKIGQTTALRGFFDPKTGRVSIYDGRHRLEATRRLAASGQDLEVIVELDSRSEEEVLKDLYQQDAMAKQTGSGERARYLLARCNDDFGGVQKTLAEALGVTEDTLNKQLAPARLDPAILNCMDSLRQIPLNPASAVVARQKDSRGVMIDAAQEFTRDGKRPPAAILKVCKAAADGEPVCSPAAEDILLGGAPIGTVSFSDINGLQLTLVTEARATPELIEAVVAALQAVLPAPSETAAS